MKIAPFILFVSAALFSGCHLIPPPEPEVRLTALPTPPHNRPVKIFFAGETLPAQPYVKIKVLSLKRRARIPTTNLVQELARQAQREGADAILVLGKSVYSETGTSTTMDSTGVHTATYDTTWDWQDVSALAIKYLDHLDYLPDYVREQRLLHWADSSWQPAATGQVNYQAPTLWQPPSDTWLALWNAYNFEENMPLKPLKYHDGYDGLRVSNWFFSPQHEQKYRIHSTANGRIESVEVVLLKGEEGENKATIRYIYDNNGQLVQRQFDTAEWGVVTEQRRFDNAGKIQSVEWIRNDQPFLKMEYAYFRPEDASTFLD